jgi:PKD repeat protein
MQRFTELYPLFNTSKQINRETYKTMKYIITPLLVISTLFANAQQTPVTPASNNLKQLETTFNLRFKTDSINARQIAQTKNIRLRYELKDGNVIEFSGFDAAGQMMFNKTTNVGSGRSISTNKVWPGGTLGTSLTGAGLTNRLGEWDGGGVLTTHQEFGGRVTQMDAPSDINFHATHVAGTMIASGIDPNAKGMSYAAPLKAYDWNNDESEMAIAANAGMLLSNHSYGAIAGWNYNEDEDEWYWFGEPTISASEDWKFGFYDETSADLDNIAFNAPNYLICFAAGNDRGDNIQGTSHLVRNTQGDWVVSNDTRNKDGNTQGYDCVLPSSVAKNVLTVGAVNKIGNSNSNNGYVNAAGVVMSSFSGWGPTDDGRIKPDVVAPGVSIYSTLETANDDYGTLQGTSMATPAVTGSLLLVQQHHNNLKGKFMRAASLKGLAIHTADEAGSNAGPDYSFGWGLLNTSKAVKFITDSNYNLLLERSLANGSTFNQGVASDGTTPLRVTISWTDRAGTPAVASLDPTNKMLVNDLDIRITKAGDPTVYTPWVLNPASPQSAATKGDNFRDNVEQILIAAPQAGTYTITVSHKGTLANNAAQNYSLLVSGIIGKPAAAFSNGLATICSNKTITFTDNSGGNPTSRNWYFPGGSPSASSAASVVVTYNTPGNFPVALKVANSLSADSVYYSNYVKVGGLKLPFAESFESTSPSLKDWSVSNGINNTDIDTVLWRLTTVAGTPPGNTAYTMPFYSYNSSNKKDLLISPPLSFYGYQNTTLVFNHAYATKNNRNDSLRISISTNCGTSWTPLTSNDSIRRTVPNQNSAFVPASAVQWCMSNCYSIDLSAYDGMSNLRIRFETTSSFGNNFYIDNVLISGNALKPVAQFGTQNQTVCAGNEIAFTDSSTNIPTKWKWTFTGAVKQTDTVQNPKAIWNVPGTYDVKLVVTNAGGSDSLIKTTYITVLPSPNKPNIVSSANGMCIGDSVLISTDSVDNGFTWYRDNIALSNTTNSYYALVAGNYQVSTSGVNGCYTKSAKVLIESGPKPNTPTVTSTIIGTAFCDGGTATLTSSATTGNQWYKDGAAIAGQTSKTFGAKEAGLYYVVTIASGCPSDSSNNLSYTLKPKPALPTITGNPNPKFNATEIYGVVSPNNGSTYNWTVTNGTPSNGTAPGTINVVWGTQTTGNVAVKETGSNGCISDAQNLVINLSVTALQSIDFNEGLKVYPNPMADVLGITFTQGTSHATSIKIINIVGQVISEETVKNISNGYTHNVDVSKLNAGIYFVEISNPEGNKQVKVLKK